MAGEECASIPRCSRLECFRGNVGWLDEAPVAIQARLLRTLLRSVKELPEILWDAAFEPCFLDVRAPYLRSLDVCFEDDDSVFSWNVLAAAPAFEEIQIAPFYDINLNAATWRLVIVALRQGALQKLKVLEIYDCLVGNRDLRDFIDILEWSGCVQRLVMFSSCGVGTEGIHCLADLLS